VIFEHLAGNPQDRGLVQMWLYSINNQNFNGKENVMKLFAMIFGGVGLILLAIGGYLYLKEATFLQHSEQVIGRVSKLNHFHDFDTGDSYCPLVEFTTQAGQQITYDTGICSDPPDYKQGQQVKVYYDPQKPQDAQLPGLWGQYGAVIILFLIGVPFSLIGVWMFFRS
jgi:hypothetical protein